MLVGQSKRRKGRALAAGELEAIDGEWKQLPPDVQTQGEAWQTQVKARLEAFALFGAISKSLSGSNG